MTAICKTIPVYNKHHLGQLNRYGADEIKTSLIANQLENTLEYAANPEKTLAAIALDSEEKELLVSGVRCTYETAVDEFADTRDKYIAWHGTEGYSAFDFLDKRTGEIREVTKKPLTALHLIQSFSEPDIDPQVAHQIGIELCEKLKVQALVCTHMNTGHIHNHIVINAYLPDGQGKFLDNKTHRMQIRALSDQIQREYGIEIGFAEPQRQLRISKDRGDGTSYREWSAKKEGTSWKDRVRNDIRQCADMCEDREELIQAMESLGYNVSRESAKFITWETPNGKKIRDDTLGAEYAAGVLFDPAAQADIKRRRAHDADLSQMRQGYQPRKRIRMIDISIYSASGRRRSELEMMIRKTIFLLQLIRKKIQQMSDAKVRNDILDAKISALEQAVATAEKYGIVNADHLAAKINDTGIKLNQAKHMAKENETVLQPYYADVAHLIAQYEQAKYTFETVRYWPKDQVPELHLKHPTEKEIATTKAKRYPIDAGKRRELYLALQKCPDLIIDGGFDVVSAADVNDYINYLNDKTDKRPALLKSRIEITMQGAYEKRCEAMRNKYNGQLRPAQQEDLRQLLKAHGYENIDVSNLTSFDLINAHNCLDPVPFTAPLISRDEAGLLLGELERHGLPQPNRRTEYITEPEYTALCQYMSALDGGLKQKLPDLLKPKESPSQMDLDKIALYVEATDTKLTIPLEHLSKADYMRLYGSLLSHGKKPTCVPDKKEPVIDYDKYIDRLNVGAESLQKITTDKRKVLDNYRAAQQMLINIGIDPEDLESITAELKEFSREQLKNQNRREKLSEEYKELLHASQQYKFAQNRDYIFDKRYMPQEQEVEITKEYEKEKEKQKQKDMGEIGR